MIAAPDQPISAAALRAATAGLPAWADVVVQVEEPDGTFTRARVVRVTPVPLAVREGPDGPRRNQARIILRVREE